MMLLKNKDRVLFIGDSITDAGRGRPKGERLGLGSGFVRQIDTLLHVCDPENLYHIINMGTDGDTTEELLARWDQDVLDLKPDVVVCCIGVNDVWRQFDSPEVEDIHISPERYKKNLLEIVDRTKDNVREFVFLTPYYIEQNEMDPMRKRMDEYRAIMKEVSAQTKIKCIDMQEAFCEYLQYRYPAFIIWDRVHPSWIGSMIMAKTFLKGIGFDKELLK